MSVSKAHRDRIRSELVAAGMTSYGLLKAESRQLPHIILEDEHIGGVVYGQAKSGSAMLIATDRRVIFLDVKFVQTIRDEVTYDVVSGVKISTAGLYATLTLHTKVTDYVIRYANYKCARIFDTYIEDRRLLTDPNGAPRAKKANEPTNPLETAVKKASLSAAAREFLQQQHLGVLSTLDDNNEVNAAAMYYALQDNALYLLTKAGTKKAANAASNQQVAFTVVSDRLQATAQLKAVAHIETDPVIIAAIEQRIAQLGPKDKLPPVAKISGGDYVVMVLTITDAKYKDFS